MHSYITDYLSKNLSKGKPLSEGQNKSINTLYLFHAGRVRQSGSPGPPGPPGPPGVPGSFSGSLEDISARVIAYLQRKASSC